MFQQAFVPRWKSKAGFAERWSQWATAEKKEFGTLGKMVVNPPHVVRQDSCKATTKCTRLKTHDLNPEAVGLKVAVRYDNRRGAGMARKELWWGAEGFYCFQLGSGVVIIIAQRPAGLSSAEIFLRHFCQITSLCVISSYGRTRVWLNGILICFCTSPPPVEPF